MKINFYQEMAPEHRSQENRKGLVPLNRIPHTSNKKSMNLLDHMHNRFLAWFINRITRD